MRSLFLSLSLHVFTRPRIEFGEYFIFDCKKKEEKKILDKKLTEKKVKLESVQ